MAKKKFLIVGSGGRESAFASRLAEDTKLYAVIGHENPTIAECVSNTGGAYAVGDPNDPVFVLEFAAKYGIDYAFVSADEPLANGVVDSLLDGGFKAIGGTREAARIEWDKVYSIEMMKKTCPEFTPLYMVASNAKEAAYAISWFQASGKGVVVKPQGLTGGKGVKVMPEHLQTYGDCTYYAQSLLEKNPKEKVLIVERLEGIEFTIMGITDGRNIVLCPASYDYPFRYEDDRGPGTGGMGCFTDRKEKLPFMTDSDLDDCKGIMQRTIDEVSANGMLFKGVLNGGFFKTKEGIRFMEFNARFGDPEGLNILSILDSSFSELLIKIWDGGLSKEDVLFARKASVIKYLVAKEYPESSKDTVSFAMDEDSIRGLDVGIFFAACVRTGRNRYRTLKSSRVVALGATAECITEASDMINDAIERHVTGPLEYRNDIGSDKNLEKLQKTFQ